MIGISRENEIVRKNTPGEPVSVFVVPVGTGAGGDGENGSWHQRTIFPVPLGTPTRTHFVTVSL